MEVDSPLLNLPIPTDYPVRERLSSSYQSLNTFILPPGSKRKYTTQFADLYFSRLTLLKHDVEAVAAAAWSDFKLGSESVRKVERVLDVRQGEVCWVAGTVFMDMNRKPNILDDLAKEAWIIAPPSREKYLNPEGGDHIMLEDESGRLQLTGHLLSNYLLCTGCIIAVLGTENRDGAFEVIEIKFADLPPQPERWSLAGKPEDSDDAHSNGIDIESKVSGKIAIVSGLEIDGSSGDTLVLDMLAEYLLGEAGDDQETQRISRLILAGNSFCDSSPIPARVDADNFMPSKRSMLGLFTDQTSYNAAPAVQLDAFVSSLLPSLPVTILPGASDPVSVSLPQQPLHAAFFQRCRTYSKLPIDKSAIPSWFDSVSNPWEGEIDGWRFLVTGGQSINDMFKYVEGNDRLGMMESFLRWRNVAPTAPDTLWTYPFQDKDPFVIKHCPHIFIAGGQPRLVSKIISGTDGQISRLVTVPSFRETGVMALLDSETLDIECIKFEIFDNGEASAPGAEFVKTD